MNTRLLDTRPKDDVATGVSMPPATAPTFQLNRDNNTTTSSTSCTASHTHLDLSLGMSLTSGSYSSAVDNDGSTLAKAGFSAAGSIFSSAGSSTTSGMLGVTQQGSSGGAKRWFSETVATVGFVHPWSLAARQEQARLKAAAGTGQPSSTSTISRCSTPVVGWPPVQTHRKNVLNICPSNSTIEVDKDIEEKKAKKSKTSEGESWTMKSAMFVKVNMQGFSVGRKINLMIHDGYESLSHALHQMFNNFLIVKNSDNTFKGEDDHAYTTSLDLIFLYEDHEGDRMLVGDVPWEMFIGSVKRLYISHHNHAHIGTNKKEKENKE